MQENKTTICLYYQAIVCRQKCWMLTGLLRSFEHLAFDRTLDKSQSLFEFFVPQTSEPIFLEVMHYFQGIGLIDHLEKLPNRLASFQDSF